MFSIGRPQKKPSNSLNEAGELFFIGNSHKKKTISGWEISVSDEVENANVGQISDQYFVVRGA